MPRDQRIRHICSFCGRNQDQVQRLVAGPGGVYVCDHCVARIAGGSGEERGANAERCSFCGKTQSQTRYSRRSPRRAAICNECIELCQQIFAEEVVTRPRPVFKPRRVQRKGEGHSAPEYP